MIEPFFLHMDALTCYNTSKKKSSRERRRYYK